MYISPVFKLKYAHTKSITSARSLMKRNVYTGAAILALSALLGTGSVLLERRAVVHAASVMAPKFEVDPFWPKPLPNHWVIGQTIGVSIDSNDNV